MAPQSRQKTVRVEDQWECFLSATPDRVRKNQQQTLTMTLSNRAFDGLSVAEKQTVYINGFRYDYSSTNSQLQQLITNAAGTASDQGIQTLISVPDIPDGDYDIEVTATPDTGGATGFGSDDFPPGLTPPPIPVTGSATISVITRLIETDSKVTLQRTFVGPTDDRALWPAIRNRTAAIGFGRYKTFISARAWWTRLSPGSSAKRRPWS